jgi:iron complex transport system permease protein
VVLGLLVGGMLALAGGAYQGVFRNPLVDPYLLGVAAGAGLGATIVIAYASHAADSFDLLPLAAFAGAALGVVLAYALGASAATAGNPAALVRCVTVHSSAVQTFIQQQHAQTLQQSQLILASTAGWRRPPRLAYVAVASVVPFHRRVLTCSLWRRRAAPLDGNPSRRLTIVVSPPSAQRPSSWPAA